MAISLSASVPWVNQAKISWFKVATRPEIAELTCVGGEAGSTMELGEMEMIVSIGCVLALVLLGLWAVFSGFVFWGYHREGRIAQ